MNWYTWLSAGSDPAPAAGPHRSVEAARAALDRFRSRHGHLAGTYEAAGSLRLVEFPTRAAARKADISDYPALGGKTVSL